MKTRNARRDPVLPFLFPFKRLLRKLIAKGNLYKLFVTDQRSHFRSLSKNNYFYMIIFQYGTDHWKSDGGVGKIPNSCKPKCSKKNYCKPRLKQKILQKET